MNWLAERHFCKQQIIKTMGLKKGMTNNPKGRPQGSLNKVTKDLRLSITEFLQSNFDTVIKEWARLDGKDKLAFYKDLLKYAIPAMQSTQFITDFDRMTDEELDKVINELKQTVLKHE